MRKTDYERKAVELRKRKKSQRVRHIAEKLATQRLCLEKARIDQGLTEALAAFKAAIDLHNEESEDAKVEEKSAGSETKACEVLVEKCEKAKTLIGNSRQKIEKISPSVGPVSRVINKIHWLAVIRNWIGQRIRRNVEVFKAVGVGHERGPHDVDNRSVCRCGFDLYGGSYTNVSLCSGNSESHLHWIVGVGHGGGRFSPACAYNFNRCVSLHSRPKC